MHTNEIEEAIETHRRGRERGMEEEEMVEKVCQTVVSMKTEMCKIPMVKISFPLMDWVSELLLLFNKHQLSHA